MTRQLRNIVTSVRAGAKKTDLQNLFTRQRVAPSKKNGECLYGAAKETLTV